MFGKPKLAALVLGLGLAVATGVARAQTPPPFPVPVAATGSKWDGLNLLLTRDRLREIENACLRGDALALDGYAKVVAAADAALLQKPDPIKGVLKVPGFYSSERALQQKLVAQLRTDGRAALALAWGYALTGKLDYATKCREFLDAWVSSLTKPVDGKGSSGLAGLEDWLIGQTGGDTALVCHYTFPLYLYAYDILNGFGQLTPAEKTRFKRWLAPFVAYRSGEERFPNNHHNWQVLFMGAAAHVTEDQRLFDTAVAYYRNGMRHQQIAGGGAMWRELARGEKAATYTVMALEAMVQFVVIADRHGVKDLRDVVAGKRKSFSWDAIQLDYVTRLKSSGVASAGGTLKDALGAIRDFVNDPTAWTGRYPNVLHTKNVNGPANKTDWGWLLEVGYAWWGDASFLPQMQAAPYGMDSPRAYTLLHATLLFRPFP